METEKYIFRVVHEVQDGRVAAVSYGGVIRVLESRAGLRVPPGYHALDGVIPPDMGAPQSPARYSCPAGELCMLCTGSPNCGGGPPPVTVTQSRLATGAPGARTILVKQSVVFAPPGAPGPCLIDGEGDPTLRIPIFDQSPSADLSAALSEYRRAAAIEDQAMAFHVYQIVGAPSELEQLSGKLIAVPVLFGVALDAAASLRRLA